MMEQSSQELSQKMLSIIPQLQGKSILILGDVGLDEYILGNVRRISPEAPVPVLDVSSEDKRLGLAANVAQNVVSLGGKAHLLSVVGDDFGGRLLQELSIEAGVSWDHVVRTSTRPTTRKTRVMAQHHHIVRVDHEVKQVLTASLEEEIFERFQELISEVDMVVLEDYAKGVITESLVQKVVRSSQALGKKILVDPHRDRKASFYKGVDLMKPNLEEAMALTGTSYEDMLAHPEGAYWVGKKLQELTDASEVVLTQGKEGMMLIGDEKKVQVPTFAQKVFDVTGAGDTVIAALALGLSAGRSLVESCILANHAAGIVVGKVGCVPCHWQELQQKIEEMSQSQEGRNLYGKLSHKF